MKLIRTAGPCTVPALGRDRVYQTGDVIDVPEKLAPSFFGDDGWAPAGVEPEEPNAADETAGE